MRKLIFVTGGARSGKSDHAMALAAGAGKRRAFLATAEALDDEMRERIEQHQAERGDGWDTHEIPLDIAPWLKSNSGKYDVVLIDCLTLWLSNVLIAGLDAEAEIHELVAALEAAGCGIVAVSNEVGMGIVPESPLARSFRDHSGRMNCMVAEVSDEAYLIVAGMPLKLRG